MPYPSGRSSPPARVSKPTPRRSPRSYRTLLRGNGGAEKVLKNAKDAAATEALEIATGAVG